MNAAKKRVAAGPSRPFPPMFLFDNPWPAFAPAKEVKEWVRANILEESGRLHNPEHAHLLDTDVEFLWANGGFTSKARQVIGQAEQVMFRASGWQKQRQELQMRAWFGDVPTYLITLDGGYCSSCEDADFCALVEHELYHIAQKRDPFGGPAFDKHGSPKTHIVGHDVEEFVGVVARYGVGRKDGAISRLVDAAKQGPKVSRSAIAGACGTCLLKLA